MDWPQLFTAFFAALGGFVLTVGLPVYLKVKAERRKDEEARERREEARAKRQAALARALEENTRATDAARRATTDHARVLTGAIPAQLPPREDNE